MKTIRWKGVGKRLLVTREVLNISDVEAAGAYGISPKTYRGYEAGSRQRGSRIVDFSEKYDVSLDWLICGEGAGIGEHLSKHSLGKIAILPAKGIWHRRLQEQRKKWTLKNKPNEL